MVNSHKSSYFHFTLSILPNAITVGRIFLSGIILVSLIAGKYSLAFYLFVLAGISDGLDGFLARQYGWFSRFGSIADPIADKILLLSSLIALSFDGYIPVWAVVLIIFRDMWVISGALAYHYWVSSYDLAPTLLSKANTFFQLLLVFLILFDLSFVALPPSLIQVCLYLVLLANTASWIDYTWVWGKKAMHMMATRRAE